MCSSRCTFLFKFVYKSLKIFLSHVTMNLYLNRRYLLIDTACGPTRGRFSQTLRFEYAYILLYTSGVEIVGMCLK
jgi:hypothetical protein